MSRARRPPPEDAIREDERRRIRRDLHDGLGPTLAAIALGLAEARALVGSDPQAARELLGRLDRGARDAVADLRRVVDDLRPSALDDQALPDALAALGRTIAGGGERLTVTVDAPEDLGPLPATLELAAYRIAAEALTNAARHSGSRAVSVRVRRDDALEIEVLDAGNGLDDEAVPGVGLRSMRERAAELGGTCLVEPRAHGGTRVRARLPLASSARLAA